MCSYPTFEDTYRPQMQNFLNGQVQSMENTVNQTSRMNDADEAERLLDAKCEELKTNCNRKIDEMKKDIKSKRQNDPSARGQELFAVFVKALIPSFQIFDTIFNQMFQKIQNLITTVVNWIRNGTAWIASTIRDTFSSIRSLF